jgi:hypothetical protein
MSASYADKGSLCLAIAGERTGEGEAQQSFEEKRRARYQRATQSGA